MGHCNSFVIYSQFPLWLCSWQSHGHPLGHMSCIPNLHQMDFPIILSSHFLYFLSYYNSTPCFSLRWKINWAFFFVVKSQWEHIRSKFCLGEPDFLVILNYYLPTVFKFTIFFICHVWQFHTCFCNVSESSNSLLHNSHNSFFNGSQLHPIAKSCHIFDKVIHLSLYSFHPKPLSYFFIPHLVQHIVVREPSCFHSWWHGLFSVMFASLLLYHFIIIRKCFSHHSHLQV